MFKIRASGAGQIMTDPREKAKKDAGELGATCVNYLIKQWVEDTYKRTEDITTLPIQKGLLNEEQGITMLAESLGEMIKKNNKHHENDFCKGTPDVILEDIVFDIKCSYSIFSFAKSCITKDYEWQLQVYMHLLGLKKSSLVYVLTDTPMSIIQAEVKSICWKLQNDDEALTIEKELIKEMTYSDIPKKDRIKMFEVNYDPAKIEALQKRVEQCQKYYNQIKL